MKETDSQMMPLVMFEDLFKENVRRLWLLASVLSYMVFPLLESFLSLSMPSIFPPILEQSWTQKFWGAVQSMAFSQVAFWIVYSFAYKRHGTKWLSFCIVISSINCLIIFAVLFAFSVLLIFGHDMDILLLIILSVNCVVELWWMIISCRLRRENRKRQLIMQFPAESANCLGILWKSANLQELKSNLLQLIQTQPLLKPVLYQAFQNRKKLFLEK